MHFKILGPLETIAAERVVTPQPAKLRAVLALLCAHAGTVVTRERLSDALWGAQPPRTARTALQVHVSKLRKHLNSHAGLGHRLITKPHGYLLELAPSELDLRVFEELREQARRALLEQKQHEALDLLHAACALWRGQALADLRGHAAFDILGRRLDEAYLDALEQRIRLQLALGQHTRVVGELYGLVAQYPTWESVYEQLMISLYRSGRLAESLEVYQRLRTTLVDELGVEPADRTQRLHHSVLARDPRLDAYLLPLA